MAISVKFGLKSPAIVMTLTSSSPAITMARGASLRYTSRMDQSAAVGHVDASAARLAVLLADCADGDEVAFEQIYRSVSAKLYSVVLFILKRRDWADEVVQDAFVRIWRNAASYNSDRGAAMTWMISIARYAALDRLRRHRREVDFVESREIEEPAEPSADLMEEVLRNDAARSINECLKELSDSQRRVILLSYCLGYTHEELSEMIGVPIGTVKSWIRRGLTRMKACLD